MEIKKLGTICKLKQGFQVPLPEQETEYREGLVRFIRIVDYTQNTEDIRYVKDNEKYYYIKPDDVVMVRYGAAGEVGHGISGVIANNMFLIEPTIDINKNYLFYYLSQEKVKHKLLSTSSSTTMPALNFKTVNNLDIPIWNKDKQNEIVGLFDILTKVIADRKHELRLFDELVKARFVEMFGDIYDEEKWDRKTWNDVVTIQNGRDYKKVAVENGGYPVYGTGGEMARASDYLCPANTIVVGRKGSINNPLLVKEKFWNVDTAFGVIPNEHVLNYLYFYEFCRNFDFMKLNKATTLPSTTKADLLKISINVPPIELQNQFADFVKQVDKSKVVVQKAFDEAQLLFDSLMQEYFG